MTSWDPFFSMILFHWLSAVLAAQNRWKTFNLAEWDFPSIETQYSCDLCAGNISIVHPGKGEDWYCVSSDHTWETVCLEVVIRAQRLLLVMQQLGLSQPRDWERGINRDFIQAHQNSLWLFKHIWPNHQLWYTGINNTVQYNTVCTYMYIHNTDLVNVHLFTLAEDLSLSPIIKLYLNNSVVQRANISVNAISTCPAYTPSLTLKNSTCLIECFLKRGKKSLRCLFHLSDYLNIKLSKYGNSNCSCSTICAGIGIRISIIPPDSHYSLMC